MKIKPLGSEGLTASELGLGCMGMSEFYGPHNDEESTKTIHRAIELGVNFFDTADMYGPYTNEELVGKALKPFRNKVVIATKFGIIRYPDDPKKRGTNGKPDYVFKSCVESLKRLGTDIIDLYYLHRKDPATEIEETVGAMGMLVKQGKVRGIGLSEVNATTLRRAHKEFPISALQTEYSLWTRDPEDELLDTCKELGIAFVAYSPLGRGFLTGQFKQYENLTDDDVRRNFPRFQGENFQRNLDIVNKIKELASKKNCTNSQLALAWVLAQKDYIFPIPGTKRIKYLEENVNSLNVQLSKQELEQLNEIAPRGIAAGTRYAEAAMASLNR